MGIIIAIVIIALIILGIILYFQLNGGLQFPWFQFYAKGKESGFIFREINLLRKAAIETNLDNPTSLFWSIRQLDKTIRGVITKYKASGKEDHKEAVSFVSKMYDFRKRVEFNSPKYRVGLKSTRDIAQHQRLRITLPGGGVYFSSVVENLRKYMAIGYPEGKDLPIGFSWKARILNVYFWRHEDAGYYFETKVLEDYSDRKFPILHISHSDSVVRSQKRRSIRAETNLPASLYNLATIENSNEMPESQPGLRGRLVDISEDGAAILVGGKAKVGMPLKVQFPLGDAQVVICGIVKGITFDKKKNRSVLHIQAVPPSERMKNTILAYVYNIFGDRKEIRRRAT